MAGQFVVLVFDRNKYIRDLVRRELKSEGYKVYSAHTFQEFISFFKSTMRFNLVVLDLELHDIDANIDMIRDTLHENQKLMVVVHTFNEMPEALAGLPNVRFVEKNASSIEMIKVLARDLRSKTDKIGG